MQHHKSYSVVVFNIFHPKLNLNYITCVLKIRLDLIQLKKGKNWHFALSVNNSLKDLERRQPLANTFILIHLAATVLLLGVVGA